MASLGPRGLCFYTYLVFCWIILVEMEDLESSPSVKEYCRGEPFEAQCGIDEVVMMTSALHGRMKLGRCIKRDEQLGCREDALLQMDSYCSGRHSCFRERITGDLEIPKCIGELASHIYASYTCLKVMRSKPVCKIENDDMIILSNTVSESGQCGSVDKPWVLEVHSSQKINITLYDMGVYSLRRRNRGKPMGCIKYGSIHEVNTGQEQPICGGINRITHLMTSQSNTIQINMSPPNQIENVRFMLQFEVLGCEDLNLPTDMWLKRGSGHVIVGCYSSRDTWRLDCVDEQWQGIIGNCTKVIPSTPGIKPASTLFPVEEIDMVVFSNEIGIAAAVVSSVFLSILLLVIGLLYDRRRTSQMERDIIQVHVAGEFAWNASNEKPSQQENGHTHAISKDEKTSADKPENYQRTSEWCQGQRPPSHIDHIYDTPSYFDLDPDYMAQSNNIPGQFNTLGNRDSYLQPTDGNQMAHLNTLGSRGNRESYLQPADGLNAVPMDVPINNLFLK